MMFRNRKNLAAALAIAALPAIALSSAAHAVTAPSGSCAAIEVIGARGTFEPTGFGYLLTPIVNNIVSESSKTIGTYPLPYPADGDYQTSEATGVSDLESYLKSESAACPSQKFVLLGYSQGAQVVGDVLASGLANNQMASIIAVTDFGDPRFNSVESFDAGSFKKGSNGILTARPTGSLSAYQAKVQNYCNSNDGICQAGQSLTGHLEYQTTAATPALTYILGKIGN